MDLNLSPDAYTGAQRPVLDVDPSCPFWVLIPKENGLSEAITFAQWVQRLSKPLHMREHLAHMALGIAGESGELVDAVKKYVIYDKPLDVDNIVEELGDLLFFMQGILTEVGSTWDHVVAHNREKLMKRYASGAYSNAQAQARADKQPQPQPVKAKPRVKLDAWWIGPTIGGTERLHGYAYDHPANGTGQIYSSQIVSKTATEVETLNTVYILGNPAGCAR